MDIDINKIIDTVSKKNMFLRVVITLIGTFLLAMNYNLFLEQHDLVIGGLTGLAIIFKKILSWNPTIFIYIATALLVVVGLFLINKKDIFKGLFVSLLYPFFITFTKPLCDIILGYVQTSDILIVTLLSSLIFGFANGIIYLAGFNTGGSDVLMKIINKYLKVTEGKATFIMNIFIIVLGGIVFDINHVVYSAIILYASSLIIDRMLIGISNTKLFYISTEKVSEVKEFIIEELHTGATLINTEGGFLKKKKKLIMCVVDNKDYYLFKEAILEIDPKAFIVIDDCYEVTGGYKRKRINLLEEAE